MARAKCTPRRIGLPSTFAQRLTLFSRRRMSGGRSSATTKHSGARRSSPLQRAKMTRRNKVVGIIPVRWASTRFPGKPLHLIAGKPLLQHVWERCRLARSLDAVIIATDEMRIAEAAFAWGAEVSLTSARHGSGTDRIAEVAAKLRGISHIINIQGDEPLVDPKLLDRLVQQMRRNPKIEMITAVHPFADPADAASPHQVKAVLDRQKRILYFSRSAIP